MQANVLNARTYSIQSGDSELSAYLVEDELIPAKLKLAVDVDSIPDAVFDRER